MTSLHWVSNPSWIHIPSFPSSYLVNFLLDSTIGLLLIYLLLKAVAKVVAYFQITALKSGEYGELVLQPICTSTRLVCLPCTGEPFQPGYWLGQLVVYMAVMLVMKLSVGPLAAFKFWKKVISHALMYCCYLSEVSSLPRLTKWLYLGSNT